MKELPNTAPVRDQLTDRDIFMRIWVSPHEVFRFINDHHYSKYVIVLLFLAGISGSLYQAYLQGLITPAFFGKDLMLCVLLGGFLGWIPVCILSFGISLTGKWFKGNGSFRSILIVLSYANIPLVVTLVLVTIQASILMSGVSLLFTNILIDGLYAIEFFLVVVVFRFYVIAIAEAHKISPRKALFNLLLSGLITGVPILLIVMLIMTL